jgi:hypothetical protein
MFFLKISFDSLFTHFRLSVPEHDGTLKFIGAHSGRKLPKNQLIAILLCSTYANDRTPAGYIQWSCDVKSPLAPYPGGDQIFWTFAIEALPIAFRRVHQVDLREVS